MALYKFGTKSDAILALQKTLNAKGYHLEEDGIFGRSTQAAYDDYQNKSAPSFSTYFPLILFFLSKGTYKMNKDQFINLVQSAVNVLSGVAVSYGILDQNTWVAVGAGVVALATFVYTHYWNKTSA